MEEGDTILCYFTGHGGGQISCNGTLYETVKSSTNHLNPTGWLFWTYLLVYVFLVLFAGLMSGLTMGLLSLDIVSLEVLKRSGKPRQQKYAGRIINLVRQHHLLLVTLLLANAAAVESMPIFLDKITNEIVAILISVTAVLVFGEIIPQAVCTRFGLAVGYYCSPLVYLLMATFFVIAFPISKLLDCLLGEEHSTFYRRTELKELVTIHGNGNISDNEEPLSQDEVLIVKSALDMRDKTAIDAMTPLESVYMLDINDRLDTEAMNEIIRRGYSRVPVYENERTNITGILLVKKLIKINPLEKKRISAISGATIKPPSCSTITPLFDILNLFQTGRSHLYLVYDETSDSDPVLVGIITLEDVIEELIGEEIVDETDVYIDVHRRLSVAKARVQLFRRQSLSGKTSTFVRRQRSKRSHSNVNHMTKLRVPNQSIHPSSLPDDQFLTESSPLLINVEIEPT